MPWHKHLGGTKWSYVADRGSLTHSYQGDRDLIIDSKQLQFWYEATPRHQAFSFVFEDAEMNLPHDFYYGAFINEIMKQVSHSQAWFKQHYLLLKRRTNLHFTR